MRHSERLWVSAKPPVNVLIKVKVNQGYARSQGKVNQPTNQPTNPPKQNDVIKNYTYMIELKRCMKWGKSTVPIKHMHILRNAGGLTQSNFKDSGLDLRSVWLSGSFTDQRTIPWTEQEMPVKSDRPIHLWSVHMV